MSLTKIFKKVLIPCAAGVANAADSEGHTYGSNCVKRAQQEGTKPSDLPIYSKDCNVCREASQCPPPAGGMEETVGNIRRELWVWQDNLKGYRHKIVDVYRRGFSKADCPEKRKSRNHLENCFDEKASCPKCQKAAEKCEQPEKPAPPKFEKLCLDRCGRPCSGEHKHHSQCQTKAQPPVNQCQTKAQPPANQCQTKGQPPASQNVKNTPQKPYLCGPCQNKAQPPANQCQTKGEPPANQCQAKAQPPACQSVKNTPQKPYLCGPKPSKLPPSEGSNKKDYCCCCHRPECSETK